MLRRQPTWEGLLDGLGWARLRLGRYYTARDAFRGALERSPDYRDASIGLGYALFEVGDYQATLTQLQPMLERAKGSGDRLEAASMRAKVAWSLYHLSRYSEARIAFEQALRDAPEWHGLHSGLGWTYLRLGRKAEARAAFQRALDLEPRYPDALEGLKLASR
jgi:tetratricopeptide (TPR) repeat protein